MSWWFPGFCVLGWGWAIYFPGWVWVLVSGAWLVCLAGSVVLGFLGFWACGFRMVVSWVVFGLGWLAV